MSGAPAGRTHRPRTDERTAGRGLLVIGDVVTDVVALHGTTGPRRGTDTAADITLRPSGSGANTAAWAAHLGGDVRLLARVGHDTADWHRAALERTGVRPHLRVDAEHATAVVIAVVDADGERTMLTSRGAGGRIGPEDWDDALLDGVARLHLSGYTLFADPGLRLARMAMERATRRGVRISVDPASAGFLRDFGPERFLAETAPADLVIPNREEALLLAGTDDVERAGELLSERYGAAVVKLGRLGGLLARGGRVVARVPAVTVRAIDSTGAGDAFAAGYLTASLRGAEDETALLRGCRAGAAATTVVGGRPMQSI